MKPKIVLNKLCLYATGLFLASVALSKPNAHAQTGPTNLNVSGALYQSNGTAITSPSVDFRIEILDKLGGCVLYTEDHTAQDLSNTKGGFSLVIGSGLSKANHLENSANFTHRLFQNSGATGAFTGCAGGVTLASGDERVIRISYDLGSGYVAMTPNVPITSSAFAMIADTLQGKTPTDFILTNVNTQLSQSSMEYLFTNTNYSNLKALVDGTSTQYMVANPGADVSFNSRKIVDVANPTNAQDASTKDYSDKFLGGQPVDMTGVAPGTGGDSVLTWDDVQNKWVARTFGSVSSITAGTGLTGGTILSTGTLSVDVGTTANKILQLNGSAQIPAVDGSLLTNVSATKLWARDISAAAPTAGQVLTWNTLGSQWEAATPSGGTITALTGDVTASGSGSVVATISDDAINSAKINSTGIAKNLLLITDNTTGAGVGYMSCGLGQVLQWDANGWGCVDMSAALGTSGVAAGTYGSDTMVSRVTVDAQGRVTALSNVNIAFPVTMVAGRTGAVTLIASDIGGLGTAALVNVGTGSSNVPQLDASGRMPAVDGSQLTNLSAGTMNGVVAGTGLSGGTITTYGTISVDVGTGANQIMQLTAGSQIPAVDGNLVTNVNAVKLQARDVANTAPTGGQVLGWNALTAVWEPSSTTSGTVTNVTAGPGLLGGPITSNGTLSVDVGTTSNKILQLTAAAQIPAVDGNLITNINAVKLQARDVAATAPSPGQVLAWNGLSNVWEPTLATAGSVTTVASGTGLIGGPITDNGTLSVDVGTSANQILQLNGSAQIPAVDGSLITNLNSWKLGGNTLSAAGTLGTIDNYALNLSTNNTPRLTILETGNVGIGTTTPYAALDLVGGNMRIAPNGRIFWAAGSTYNGDVNLSSVGGVGSLDLEAFSNTNLRLKDSGGTGATLSMKNLTFPLGGAVTFGTANVQDAENDGHSLRFNSYQGFFDFHDYNSGTSVMRVDAYNSRVGVGTGTPLSLFHVAGTMRVSQICDEAGLNCKTVSGGWGAGGSVTNVSAGTGLTGGNISTAGTLSVDVGTTSYKIVQLDGSAQLPAVDGSQLSNLNATRIGTRTIATTAPSPGQFIGWNTSTSEWEPMAPATVGTVTNVATGTGLLGGPISSNGTLSVDVGTGANQILQLTAGSQIPAVDGFLITNINAYRNGGNFLGANGTLGSKDNYSLSLITNNQNRLTVDASGNVGIGTSTPGSKLSIEKSNVATYNGAETMLSVLRVDDGSGADISIDSIGVNTVGSRLLIGRPSAGPNALVKVHNTTDGWGWDFGLMGGTNNFIFKDNITGNNVITFEAWNQPNRIYIKGDGSIGIGTSSPSALLDVAGTMRVSQICDEAGLNCKTVSGGWGAGGSVTNVSAGTGLTGGNISTAGTLSVDVGTTSNKILQLNASGQIPAVDGSLITNVNAWRLGGNTTGADNSVGTIDNFGFTIKTNNTARLTVANDGNVGIGTGTPQGALHIRKAGGAGVTLGVEGSGSYSSLRIGNTDNLGIGSKYLELTGGDEAQTNYDAAVIRSVGYGAHLQLISGTGLIRSSPISNEGLPALSNRMITLRVGHGADVNQNPTLIGSGGFGVYAADSNSDMVVIETPNLIHNRPLFSITQAGNSRLYVAGANGAVGVGTANPQALLDLSTTTSGQSAIIVPRDTAANRPATGINGMIRYNTNTSKFEAFENNAWVSMTASGAGATASGTAGAIQVSNGSGAFTSNNNMVVDSSTGRIGIGTSNPTAPLNVQATNGGNGYLVLVNPPSGNDANIGITRGSNADQAYIGLNPAGANSVTNVAWSFGMLPNDNNFNIQAWNGSSTTSYVTVKNNGNVGIGTITPSTAFETFNDFKLGSNHGPLPSGGSSSASSANGLYLSGNGSSWGVAIENRSATGDIAQFYSNGAIKGSISQNGHIGVGIVSTSSYGVYVRSDSNNTSITSVSPASIVLRNPEMTTNNMGSVAFAGNDGTPVSMIQGVNTNHSTGSNSGELAFVTMNTAVSSEKMRITSGGNVGIGTATPGYKLDVNGAINASSIYLNGSLINLNYLGASVPSTGGYSQLIEQTLTDTATNYRSALIVKNNGASSAYDLNFAGHNSSGTITSGIFPDGRAYFAGNVGIGTPSPTGKLQVSGAINAKMQANAFGTSSAYTALVLGDLTGATADNGGLYAIARKNKSNEPFVAMSGWDDGSRRVLAIGGGNWDVPDATQVSFYTAAAYNETNNAAVERIRITSSGNVGIGTTTPNEALEVSGNVKISGTINASQAFATLTDSATITWTVAGLVNNASVTLGGNRTLSFSGLTNGMSGTLIVKQDGTGSRTLALPSQCTNKVINGGGSSITLTTTGNAIDILTFIYDGTNCYWAYGKNY